MGTVTKHFPSNVGNTTGSQLSSHSAREIWLVGTDNRDDDPTKTLMETDGGVPSGAFHPWHPHLQSDIYTVAEHINEVSWFVDVLYVSRLLAGSIWRMRAGGSLRGRRLRETIDSEASGERKLIGSLKYVGWNENDNCGPATHFCDSTRPNPDDPCSFLPQQLRQSQVRNVEGFEATDPTASVTLFRTFPELSAGALGGAISLLGKINNVAFLGAQPGHIRFEGFDIGDREGTLPGQPVLSNTVWDVALTFGWSVEKYSPLELVHVFEDDEGGMSIVRSKDTQEPVKEFFNVIPDTNLSIIQGLFE